MNVVYLIIDCGTSQHTIWIGVNHLWLEERYDEISSMYVSGCKGHVCSGPDGWHNDCSRGMSHGCVGTLRYDAGQRIRWEHNVRSLSQEKARYLRVNDSNGLIKPQWTSPIKRDRLVKKQHVQTGNQNATGGPPSLPFNIQIWYSFRFPPLVLNHWTTSTIYCHYC